MTRTQSTIPFQNLPFHDDLLKLRDIETRLKTFLKKTREKAQRVNMEADRMTDDDRVYPHDLVDEADMHCIKRRAMWFLDRHAPTDR